MQKQHPHFGATYRIVPLEDATFAVEVSIPERPPTTITSFVSHAAAETWIANHKSHVAAPPKAPRWRDRPRRPDPSSGTP